MATIKVTKVEENQLMKFAVTVDDGNGQTQHTVTLNRADYFRTTNRYVTPEKLIEKSFEFLLEHEPKEDILPKFDFTMINRFFPQFNKEIRKRTGVI